jgi:hypothetical protein
MFNHLFPKLTLGSTFSCGINSRVVYNQSLEGDLYTAFA